jgi:hypothetical protein
MYDMAAFVDDGRGGDVGVALANSVETPRIFRRVNLRSKAGRPYCALRCDFSSLSSRTFSPRLD